MAVQEQLADGQNQWGQREEALNKEISNMNSKHEQQVNLPYQSRISNLILKGTPLKFSRVIFFRKPICSCYQRIYLSKLILWYLNMSSIDLV